VSDPIARYLRRFTQDIELVFNCPRGSDIPKVNKLEARRQLGLPPDAYIISYVGTIRYDCRLDLMLDVASLLWERDNIRFVIVGWGPLASNLREAMKTTRARLSFVSYVPHERALYYVAASDLSWGIYQNRSLNMRLTIPWKFFESLACRVPLIVDEGTYRAALVKEFKSGIVLEGDDPRMISRLIQSLAADRSDTERTLDIRSLPPEFTWEGTARRLIAVYKRLSTMKSEV
jgi:glycosyltransferase involved in cell wall biosynthesis